MKKTKLPNMFLIIGKNDKCNFYRDIIFSQEYLSKNFNVTIIIPSKQCWEFGYEPDDARLLSQNDSNNRKFIYMEYEEEIIREVKEKEIDIVIFSQNIRWKNLIRSVKAIGVKTVSYSSFSGLDHHPYGEDLCIFSSEYEYLINMNKFRYRRHISTTNCRIIGGISEIGEKPDLMSDGEFREKYSLRSSDKIVAFFPKNLDVLAARAPSWFRFKFRSKSFVEKYLKKIDSLYQESINELKDLGFVVLEIMHPSSKDLSNRYDTVIIQRNDKAALINSCIFGFSVTSNVTKDLIRKDKPMLYVGSRDLPSPNFLQFLSKAVPEEFLRKDLNGKILNKYTPAWVGEYANKPEGLKRIILQLIENKYDYTSYKKFYWANTCTRAVAKSISEVVYKEFFS